MAVDSIRARTAAIDPRQAEHYRVWSRKPVLRILYADHPRRLLEACPEGPILKAGGGTGHLNDRRKDGLCGFRLFVTVARA